MLKGSYILIKKSAYKKTKATSKNLYLKKIKGGMSFLNDFNRGVIFCFKLIYWFLRVDFVFTNF